MCDWSSSVGLEKRLHAGNKFAFSLHTHPLSTRSLLALHSCINQDTYLSESHVPSTDCIFCPLRKELCNSPDPRAVPCLLRGAWIHALCHAGLWQCWESAETSLAKGRRCLSPPVPLAGEGAAGRGAGVLSLSLSLFPQNLTLSPRDWAALRALSTCLHRGLGADGQSLLYAERSTPYPRVISSFFSPYLFIYF